MSNVYIRSTKSKQQRAPYFSSEVCIHNWEGKWEGLGPDDQPKCRRMINHGLLDWPSPISSLLPQRFLCPTDNSMHQKVKLCKHTLVLSLPLGTVGHTMGCAVIPRERRYADFGCGDVSIVWWERVDPGSGRWKVRTEWDEAGLNFLCDSKSDLNNCIIYEERSRSLVDK